MCGLYGFLHYGNNEKVEKGFNGLLTALGEASAVRGTDATGYSYVNNKNKVVIKKAAKSAVMMDFKVPSGAKAVMGHTRNTTQGNAKINRNNHPFKGNSKGSGVYAFAHNGVLTNEYELKATYKLPKTNIETDSYVAVQLLDSLNGLTHKNFKELGETVEGMFAFTILDRGGNLHIIRNDSPFHIIHFKRHQLYVYASTESILFEALSDSPMANELLKEYMGTGGAEFIEPGVGEILTISSRGHITKSTFKPRERIRYYNDHLFNRANGYGVGGYTSYGNGSTYISIGSTTSKSKVVTFDKPKNECKSLEEFYDNENYNSEDGVYYNILLNEIGDYGYNEEHLKAVLSQGYSLLDVEYAIYDDCLDGLMYECMGIPYLECAEEDELE